MLSIANEVDLLFFPLGMFCMRYKHVFFQQDCHGLEDRRKRCGSVLGLKVGCRPSKGRVGS